MCSVKDANWPLATFVKAIPAGKLRLLEVVRFSRYAWLGWD